MKTVFQRSKSNPILRPNPDNRWEAEKLYNPGAVFYGDKYHLFYRAIGKGENWQSAIGYAVSADGENFERHEKPLIIGENDLEKRGLEDPRITRIGNTFYMAYAAYDGITPRLSLAVSQDLKTWKKTGPAFSDWAFEKAGGIYTKWDENGNLYNKPKLTEWSKSGAIFPEKIAGKFLMLFGEHRIWFAASENGIDWTGEQKPFLGPRQGNFFDNAFVEMGPPPIKTEKGYLALYHGIDRKRCYRIGFLLLDQNNPRKILYRSNEPIFWPEKDYERSGLVDVLPGGLEKMQKMTGRELEGFLAKNEKEGTMPAVTFCCGATVVNNILRIYYGASDSVICTATADMDDILRLAD